MVWWCGVNCLSVCLPACLPACLTHVCWYLVMHRRGCRFLIQVQLMRAFVLHNTQHIEGAGISGGSWSANESSDRAERVHAAPWEALCSGSGARSFDVCAFCRKASDIYALHTHAQTYTHARAHTHTGACKNTSISTNNNLSCARVCVYTCAWACVILFV